MKLAEALIIRADLQTRLRELRARLSANALCQEGERPAEDPNELLEELEGGCRELSELMTKINLVNAGTIISGRSLTELLAERDVLSFKVGALQELLNSASRTADRASGSEIKIRSSVDVRALRKSCDSMSRELRELDTRIQEANWLTEMD